MVCIISTHILLSWGYIWFYILVPSDLMTGLVRTKGINSFWNMEGIEMLNEGMSY